MRLTTSVRFAPVICISIALSFCAISPLAALATTLTWTTTPGAGNTDGSGTWQDGSGGWNISSGTATNWSSANPDSAVIGAGNGAAGTINVLNNGTTPVTIGGTLEFRPAGSSTYLISDSGSNSNTISFSNTTITNNADAKIAVNLAANSAFSKNGPGQLTYVMGTGYTTASLLASGVSITATNGTLLMGEASGNGPRYMDGTNSGTVILGGGTMRFNNTTTPGNFVPAIVTLNAGQSLISQVNNAANRFQVGTATGFTRNVGSIFTVTASSTAGSGGFLTGNNMPLTTSGTQFTTPGYVVIVNTNGLSSSNGRGQADVGCTTTSGGGNVQGNLLTYFVASSTNPESNLGIDSEIYENSANTFLSSFTTDHSVRGMKLSANSSGQSLDLAGHNIALEGGGLIFAPFGSSPTFTGNFDYTITDSAGTGSLRGGYGLATGTSSTAGVRDLIVYQSSPVTKLTIVAVIADNNTGVGTSGGVAQPTGFTKGGPGLLVLSGNNTYTGSNYLNQGVTSISSNANLGSPTTGASVFLGGGTLLSTANVILDNAGTFQRNFTIADKGGALAADATHTLTVSGVISTLAGATTAPVTFGVATSGTGTVNLTGNNIYTGTTTVAAGTLLVNGTNSGGGKYTVASGGTLGGSGSIITANNAGASVLAGGKLSPGNSPGALSMDLGTGVLDISSAIAAVNSQSMLFDLDTPATSDKVVLPNAASSLNIGSGTLAFDDFVFTPTGSFGPGDYTLFDTNHPISGFFDVFVDLQGVVGGYNASLDMADNNQDIVLHVTTPVPEPSTVFLLTLGGLGLLVCRRRR